MMQYKSKTMQSLAAQRSDDLRLVQKFVADVGRMKQSLEELDGTRGNNPALRKSDLHGAAGRTVMTSPVNAPDTVGAGYKALRRDIQTLFEIVAKLTGQQVTRK